MALMSKTKLGQLLTEKGFIGSPNAVGYESYGRKTMAYIRVRDMVARKALESFLRDNGQKPNLSYWPGAPVVETQVSYFKALHWDE